MLAIIGGSLFNRLPELNITHRQVFRTPYGEPSCPLLFGKLGQNDVVFLARHGLSHHLAPHDINYRANIDALAQVNVSGIVGICSTLSLHQDLTVGDIVLPHDLIDYTYNRQHTFFEGNNMPVVYPDFSEPYHPTLRQAIMNSAEDNQINLTHHAVLACLQGPRLPTNAEVRRLKNDGSHLYNMSAMPEAILALERDIPYANLCVITQDLSPSNNPDENLTQPAIKLLQNIILNELFL